MKMPRMCIVILRFFVKRPPVTSPDDVTSPEAAISNLHHTSSALCLHTAQSVKEYIKFDTVSVYMTTTMLHTGVVNKVIGT